MVAASRTTTSTALLDALHDASNEEVWREFDTRYRPIILGFARKLGLSEEDAADVAQDTLARFVEQYRAGRYDRTRGRLRSWIIGIVKFRIFDLRRKQAVRREARGESAMLDLSDDSGLDVLWDEQRRKVLLQQAIAELREHTRLNERTIQAFEMYAIAGRPVDDVAAELGFTASDVYGAKSKVAERLREILQRLEELFDDG